MLSGKIKNNPSCLILNTRAAPGFHQRAVSSNNAGIRVVVTEEEVFHSRGPQKKIKKIKNPPRTRTIVKESGQKRSGGQFQYHNQTLIHIDTVIRGWKVSKSFTATTLTALSIPRQHRAKAYKEHESAVVHKVLFNQVYLLWHETTVLSSVFTGRGFLSAYLYS